jgi:hypothetical protein
MLDRAKVMVKDAIAEIRDMISQFFVGWVEHSETQLMRDMISQFFVGWVERSETQGICEVSSMLGFVPQLCEVSSMLGFVPQLCEVSSMLGFVPQPNLRIKFFVGWVERSETQGICEVSSMLGFVL